MAKIGRLREYESEKQAIRVRIEACNLAVNHMAGVDDPTRLNAYCVFFENYIASGPKWTEKHMHLLEPPPDPEHKPVVRLIQRDD